MYTMSPISWMWPAKSATSVLSNTVRETMLQMPEAMHCISLPALLPGVESYSSLPTCYGTLCPCK